jgi:NAD(P)H-flavin reductase
MRAKSTNVIELNEWEVFPANVRNRESEPRIRLNSGGTITFTRAAVEQFKIGQFVKILVNPKNKNRIALQNVMSDGENTRRITHTSGTGAASLNIESLVKRLGIKGAHVATIEKRKDMIVLDFSGSPD